MAAVVISEDGTFDESRRDGRGPRRAQRAGAPKTATLLRQPDLVIWALVVLAMPIYAWRSGRPQPADFLSLALLPLMGRVPLQSIPQYLKGVLGSLFAFARDPGLVILVW